MRKDNLEKEIAIDLSNESTKEVSFHSEEVKPAPLDFCRYCQGMGYRETGNDSIECPTCNGTGRKKK